MTGNDTQAKMNGADAKGASSSLLALLVNGALLALPVVLVGALLGKSFQALRGVVHPMLDAMPGVLFQNPTVRFLAVCAVLAGLLILVGALARTVAGKRLGRWLEGAVLRRLPLYQMFRNLTGGLADRDSGAALHPVLVTVNPGLQQLGLLIERHADGNCTVFLPSSPNPGSGTVLVVEAAMMRELRVPAHKLFKCMSGWGDGTAALLARAHQAQSGTADGSAG